MTDPWEQVTPTKKTLFVPTKTVKQVISEDNANVPDTPPDDLKRFPEHFEPEVIELSIPPENLFIDDVNAEINNIIKIEKEGKTDKLIIPDDNSKAKQWDNIDVVSFSLIDKMFYKGNEIDHCPAKIYGNMIGLKEEPTDPMKAGNLFETLLLGESREGEKTLQLDRKQVSQKQKNEALKKGLKEPEPEMRIDEIRIRHQVERSKILFFNHKINVISGVNTQVPVYKIWNGIKIWGHIDLFPTPVVWNGEERLAIIDTKLTGSLSSSFGKYCWGDPTNIDFTQALVYFFLLEDIDYSINPYLLKIMQKERQFDNLIFLYFVADYKVAQEKLDMKFFEVLKINNRMKEVQEIIRKCHASIDMYKQQSWPTNPQFEFCKNCPLNYKRNGTCKMAVNNQVI